MSVFRDVKSALASSPNILFHSQYDKNQLQQDEIWPAQLVVLSVYPVEAINPSTISEFTNDLARSLEAHAQPTFVWGHCGNCATHAVTHGVIAYDEVIGETVAQTALRLNDPDTDGLVGLWGNLPDRHQEDVHRRTLILAYPDHAHAEHAYEATITEIS